MSEPTIFPPDAATRATALVPIFVRHWSPRLVAAALAAVLVARGVAGSWSWWDLVIAAALIAAQPFTEWLIHVCILHFKPRRVGRVRIDLDLARKHRAHHTDPSDIGLIFIPWSGLIGGGVLGTLAIVLLIPDTPQRLTAALVALALTLHYEWVHYFVHTPYRPRSRFYRYAWRAHRLHHFRNEHYWFGVTVHLADHVFGTFPDKSSVPLSPTARSLHADVDAGTGAA